MLPEAQHKAFELMEDIKCHREPHYVGNRLHWAAELGDLLPVPGETHMMNDTLEHLVMFVIPNEPEPKVIDELFRALEYGCHYSSVDVNLDPLVDEVGYGGRDTAFLCWVLLVLAKQGSDRHIDFVRAHLTSEHDTVRKNAQYAWDHRYAAVEKRLRGEWSLGGGAS
jgi:hypothetical protein